jgi:DNA-binding Lrp family transcriptional regulator
MLDDADIRILRLLQDDGRLTNQELAQRANLSTSACWRRVKRLEDEGIIRGYRAELDRRAVGLGVMAFIRVQIDSHLAADAGRFVEAVGHLDEVVACYAVTGEADFLLQVVASDLDSFGDFAMTVIGRLPGIKAMHSTLTLKEIKAPTALPLSGGAPS